MVYHGRFASVMTYRIEVWGASQQISKVILVQTELSESSTLRVFICKEVVDAPEDKFKIQHGLRRPLNFQSRISGAIIGVIGDFVPNTFVCDSPLTVYFYNQESYYSSRRSL
ncbi:hypothetical protein J6590_060593 [Homalodisca vitripennis]|nr:hypothetical protein J6590_060593 [Homalodisca vitripennis]